MTCSAVISLFLKMTTFPVRIEVADTGPGLTDEQVSRVFERFYRADPSRSRQRGGAGLGLGIVASIVAAHGGRVAAASSVSGGAVFTVRLPLAITGDNAGGRAHANPAHTPASP